MVTCQALTYVSEKDASDKVSVRSLTILCQSIYYAVHLRAFNQSADN